MIFSFRANPSGKGEGGTEEIMQAKLISSFLLLLVMFAQIGDFDSTVMQQSRVLARGVLVFG